MFSCEFREIYQNSLFIDLRATAYGGCFTLRKKCWKSVGIMKQSNSSLFEVSLQLTVIKSHVTSQLKFPFSKPTTEIRNFCCLQIKLMLNQSISKQKFFYLKFHQFKINYNKHILERCWKIQKYQIKKFQKL